MSSYKALYVNACRFGGSFGGPLRCSVEFNIICNFMFANFFLRTYAESFGIRDFVFVLLIFLDLKTPEIVSKLEKGYEVKEGIV